MDERFKSGIYNMIQAEKKASLFITPLEQMQIDNYLRAFDEEIKRLGEENFGLAMEETKKREPEGFAAIEKLSGMEELFESRN